MLNKLKTRIKYKVKNWITANFLDFTYHEKDNPHDINFARGSMIVAPLKLTGGNRIYLGENTRIQKGAWLAAFESYSSQHFTPKIIIEDNVHIGHYACITAVDRITIERGCLISEYVYISDHSHGLNPSNDNIPAVQNLETKGPVFIGARTFLGYRVSILSGVSLGRNCIVGAHSVVTKSFPDYSMIAGAPAKIIKQYCTIKKKWVPI